MIEEILSKTDDPKTPVEELEFYELSLLDEANDLGTRHVVKQWHGAWSEIDRQIMWDGEEVEYFWILAQASLDGDCQLSSKLNHGRETLVIDR